MNVSSDMWLKWAEKFMPQQRTAWLRAMRNEYEQVSNAAEQNAFAFGCFKVALLECVRSRKGLSWLARTGGALFLFAFSSAAILWSIKDVSQPEAIVFAKIITAFCLSYLCAATLLMTSLKGLKVYSGIGFCVMALGWTYSYLARPSYEYLPVELLMALSLEAGGIMIGLFVAAIYLSWLYNPNVHDA